MTRCPNDHSGFRNPGSGFPVSNLRSWISDLRFTRLALLAIVCLAALLIPSAGPAVVQAAEEAVGIAELDPRTERAIDRGLRSLAASQQADGSWGGGYKAANTSVALMAFMLKGYFPDKGEHGKTLDKAVGYLLKRIKDGGGYVGGNMYEHGLTTLALSEAWGMSRRTDIRDALKKAVEIILRAQSREGGWRYHPKPLDADLSVTVMQIVALASAREAGIYVPDATIDKAKAYVKRLQDTSGGFGYQSAASPGFARSAAGVMSLLMLGERDSRAVQKGLAYLHDQPESVFQKVEHYYYGHYYAVQAMYQAGDAHYQKWYPKIRDALLTKQAANGSWGSEFDTGLSVLILGVPYRYLPIYQR